MLSICVSFFKSLSESLASNIARSIVHFIMVEMGLFSPITRPILSVSRLLLLFFFFSHSIFLSNKLVVCCISSISFPLKCAQIISLGEKFFYFDWYTVPWLNYVYVNLLHSFFVAVVSEEYSIVPDKCNRHAHSNG